MKTTIQEENGIITALLEGELDTAAAAQADEDFKPLRESDAQEIVLDCTELKYISSSGLRLFLSLLKVGKARGAKVSLKGLNPDLIKVFKMTGFYDLFAIK